MLPDPLASLLAAGLESDDQFQAALDATLEAFACPTGTLHTVETETGPLHLRAHRGIPDELMPVVNEIPIGKGIAGAAAESREPVQLCNLQQDLGGVAKEGARKTEVAGSLAVALLDGNTLKGTIGIGKFEPYEFPDEEIERLWEVARAIAAAL